MAKDYIYLKNEGTRLNPSSLRANITKALVQGIGAENSIVENIFIFSKDSSNCHDSH
jgi:hypothetical protein